MATEQQQDRTKPRVGLLGVGLMGSAMAARLVDQGLEVIAWDRSKDRLQALTGVDAAATPAEAVAGARIVITMLSTADVVLGIVEPLLENWPEDAVWLQMSSVGADESDRLSAVADEHGVTLVDAPVSGSTHPAREGLLTILASGPDSARGQVEPVFSALAQRVIWAGRAGMGSRLKLAANNWMLCSLAAAAETMRLCEAMDLDQEEFARLLDGGALGSPYVVEKLGEMIRHDYPAGFPVRLAVKDLGLVHEVLEGSDLEMPVLEAALGRFTAAERSRADEDAAAVYESAGASPGSGTPAAS
jgi:3-hydroxyisobutyrate dehydrogenase